MNRCLFLGGIFSILTALLHIAIIIGGPDWYRFWGAGEKMAVMAENGSWIPSILTFIIILFIWGLYAFSGAGLVKKLPFLKTALVIISLIYSTRGLSLILVLLSPRHVTGFLFWTSLVSLVVGVVYSFGTKQMWASISK